MSPTTTTVLIDYHPLLNVPLYTSAITPGHAQDSGVWTVWNKVSWAVEQYYSAYAIKQRDTRLSVQLVTNNGLISVNDEASQDQSLTYFRDQLKSIHSDNIASNKGRLQSALRTAVEKLVTDCSGDTLIVRANLLVMVLAKQNDETTYEFSDDTADQNASKLDIRAVLYKIGRELALSKPHINVQVVKIYQDDIPSTIAESASQDILSNLSLSLVNISCQDDGLQNLLETLAMSHFDLSNFIIYNIGGMQENTDKTHVQCLCSHGNAHILDYTSFLDLRLEYVQNVRRDGIDLPKFRCLHPIVLNNQMDKAASQLFQLVSNKKNIMLLHDRKNHEQNYHYTHAIISYSNNIYLVCFDRSAEPEFEEAKNSALELIEVKAEGMSKSSTFEKRNIMATSSFMEAIIGPNLVDNLDHIKPFVKYSPNRYSVPNSATINIEASYSYCTTTTENLERNTRWWLSFADAFDREVTDDNGASPLQNMTKAFELSSNMTGDILDLIRQELVKPGSSNNTFGDRLVPEFFRQLNEAEMEGSHGKLFSKRLSNAAVRALAKKLFIALDLASRRFQHADGTASTICLQIRKASIAYQNRVNKPNTEVAEVFTKDEPNNVDAAWQQINNYQNMTLREKEEALQPNIDVKPKAEPMPFANQLPLGLPAGRGRGRGSGPRGKSGPAINPMFRGRRGHDTPTLDTATTLQYPDVRAAKPWLEPIKPDPNAAEMKRKQKDEQLGAQNSLLRTYWESTERQQFGDGTNKHDGRIWVTNSQKGVRKRLKKEFDGRLDPSLVTRSNSGDHSQLADLLPL